MQALYRQLLILLIVMQGLALLGSAVIAAFWRKVFSGYMKVLHQEQLEAIKTKPYKFGWPVGLDARGIFDGRPKISDEDWILMGGDLSDKEYNERFKEYFDIQL